MYLLRLVADIDGGLYIAEGKGRGHQQVKRCIALHCIALHGISSVFS